MDDVFDDLDEQPKIGQLKTPADAHRFVFAGNAILTLRSKKTQTRFTYKVTESEDHKAHFVKVLTGPENTSDYVYLGHFIKGIYYHGRKSKVATDAPSARAFNFFVSQLDGLTFHEALEVWHEGRCCRCGRTLTVPESVELGIGPECAGKMGVQLISPPKKTAELKNSNVVKFTMPVTVHYSSVDSHGRRMTKTYKTIGGAIKFAQSWIGDTPSISSFGGYAVSDDGVGKIECEGCSLYDLFPRVPRD